MDIFKYCTCTPDHICTYCKILTAGSLGVVAAVLLIVRKKISRSGQK